MKESRKKRRANSVRVTILHIINYVAVVCGMYAVCWIDSEDPFVYKTSMITLAVCVGWGALMAIANDPVRIRKANRRERMKRHANKEAGRSTVEDRNYRRAV